MTYRKPFDANALIFDAQSLAAWAVGTEDGASIDLGVADADSKAPGEIISEFTGLVGTGATIQVILADSADDATFATVLISEAFAITSTELQEHHMPIPKKNLRRYIRASYVIAVANITAGALTSGMVK